MKTFSSAHVHTQFCDGKNTAEEMVLSALEKGFISLGFSSHAPQLFDDRYSLEHEAPYRAEIHRLQEKYRDQIKIFRGIERDFYSIADPTIYDYFIASVHVFPGEAHYMVDGPADQLNTYIQEECGGDAMKMVRKYYEMLSSYVTDAHPAIIGHFDLVRKNNPLLHLFDEDDPAYLKIALEALESMKDTGALLEINTGGMARGYLPTPYPTLPLLRQWKEWGNRVIVNSDCHQAPFIAYAFDEAEALLRAAGYSEAVRLGSGKEMWETYPL